MEILFIVFFTWIKQIRSSQLKAMAAAAASKAKTSMPATLK
jgi:hypothetical protein